MVKLKYVGDGSFYPIEGLPAADHEQENEVLAEKLVAGGLYEYVEKKKQAAADKAEVAKEPDEA